jgi:succinyl-CoA synthetase beta subunit
MELARFPYPKSVVAHSFDEAVRAAESIGYPVVMKIVSRDILHKSDAGGIALGLDNREEVIDAYEAIMLRCRAYAPDARIDGIEVAEMVRPGREMIIGARRDRAFGPIVICGLGGIYVEVMKDVTFRAHPLSRGEAGRMLKEIRSYPLLLGVRGEAKKDIEALIDGLLAVGSILRSCPLVTDIEMNPVVVYEEGEGIKAVDVRVLVARP